MQILIYRLHNYYCHLVTTDEYGTPERVYECYLKEIHDRDDHNGQWRYMVLLEYTQRLAFRTITEFDPDEEITMRHSLEYIVSIINEAFHTNINPQDYTYYDAETLEHLSDLPYTFNIFQPEYSFCFFSRPKDEIAI
jgi:hypothetical protein